MTPVTTDRPTLATVLVCTFNRAPMLARALRSLSRIQTRTVPWRLLIVDNNSNDGTRALVESHAARFPVELRYVFEPRQGKSHALNRGLAEVRSPFVVFGDDDQEFDEYWVEEACTPLLADRHLSYTGGPVLPRFVVPPPEWMDWQAPELRAPLGLFHYGDEPFTFERRRLVPGGGNMAVRRSLFDRIGGFHTGLGRRGTSLLGQEQAEFFHRSRAAGACGRYVPTMRVEHWVPAERLTRAYHRRWWFWKGVGQARVYAMHCRTELGLDLSRIPHVATIPRFVLSGAVRDAYRWLRSAVTARGDGFAHELHVMYALGYLANRRRLPQPQTVTALPLPQTLEERAV
jgi:glycosyltransferase involved in cell wall biosynthesis